MKPNETRQGKAAESFAAALVRGDFDAAHEMLTVPMKHEFDVSSLRNEFEEMTDYGDGPPDYFETMETLDDWPTKEPADVGWAYVAISGPGFSEGLSVVVNRDEAGETLIREIEWGRP